jgi:type VI secretion system secreted protein Hcp
MSFNLFLTVSGVTGESVQRAHEGQIELSSWNLGVHNHAMAGPGGGGKVGKAQWDELIVTMPTTAALPQLMGLCASGQHVEQAVLTAESVGDARFVWLRLTVSDVVVTSVGTAASSPDDLAEDEVALTFGSILLEKFSQNDDGTPGAPVTFAWSVRKNRGSKASGSKASGSKATGSRG